MHAGRLGASLAAAAARAGWPVAAVSRRSPPDAERVAGRVRAAVGPAADGPAGADGPLATSDPERVVEAADVVFLTTRDDGIAEVAAALPFRPGQLVAHCSGAMPLSTLAPAAARGAAVAGFHPLQTFPDEEGAARFRGITFGIEAADPEARATLERLAEDLGGRVVALDAATRPLYHAAAVLAGPLVAGLAGVAGELWSGLGRDRRGGLEALAPLLVATAEGVAAAGVPDAMTGPFVRGDVEPVRAHLAALADRPATRRAYAALALAQLPIARERGNIPDARHDELLALLRGALDERDS